MTEEKRTAKNTAERTAERTALWLVLLAAAGTFALTMGTRQTMGLFLSPLNTATGQRAQEKANSRPKNSP